MTNLAIKGHPERGNEVIEILEMLGGKNIHRIDAIRDYYVYFVMDDKNKTISSLKLNQVLPEQFIIYSLEEFLEKFPYKVGDKVYYDVCGIQRITTIMKMEYYEDFNDINCTMENGDIISQLSESMQPYKEETMEENKTPKTQADVDKYLQEHPVKNGMNVIDIERCLETDGLKLPENVVINSKGIGSIQFIQWYEKQQYPKTYEECCDILDIYPIYNKPNLCICEWHPETREMHEYYSKLANLSQKDIAFMILRICRDAYWKIAGEQMELGKPWEPDYTDDNVKYVISIHRNHLDFNVTIERNYILIFPTEEMRDMFYENFKDLIEECKELL